MWGVDLVLRAMRLLRSSRQGWGLFRDGFGIVWSFSGSFLYFQSGDYLGCPPGPQKQPQIYLVKETKLHYNSFIGSVSVILDLCVLPCCFKTGDLAVWLVLKIDFVLNWSKILTRFRSMESCKTKFGRYYIFSVLISHTSVFSVSSVPVISIGECG